MTKDLAGCIHGLSKFVPYQGRSVAGGNKRAPGPWAEVGGQLRPSLSILCLPPAHTSQFPQGEQPLAAQSCRKADRPHWGCCLAHPALLSCSVKLNEHFLNTSDFLDTIKSNLDKALGQ